MRGKKLRSSSGLVKHDTEMPVSILTFNRLWCGRRRVTMLFVATPERVWLKVKPVRSRLAAGSASGLYLIVSDIQAARAELLDRGVEVSEAFHGAGNVYSGVDEPYLFGRLRVSGPDLEHRSYRSLASFSDADGNGWLLQEITTRSPGRVDTQGTT